MRWLGPLVVALTACASAGSPEGTTDAAGTDAPVRRDAAIDAPGGDAPPMMSCASSDTCAAAMMLGTVSGDTGNAKLSASGYRAAWFRVRVSENDSGVFGLTLRVGAKLTSPIGENFDAILYVNTGADVVECTTPRGTATVTGNVEETRIEWGETGTFSNGSNDDRDVSIEIRPVTTNCSPSAMWQLEVEGNWI